MGATGTSTFTLLAADDVTPSNTAAVPFWYKEIASDPGDTEWTLATVAGFTRAEMLMLGTLMQTVSHTSIALCLDPDALDRMDGEPDPLELFAPTLTTYQQLLTLMDDLNLTREPPMILSQTHRFASAGALAHVEEGDMLRTQLAGVKKLARYQPIDAVNLRREIAERVIDLESYPF